MINPRICAVWSTTKQIAPFSSTPCVQEVHTRAEVVHLTPGLLGLGVIFSCHAYECIAKHIINPRISADWSTTKQIAPFSTTKQIAPFSCIPRVQEVHNKAEIVQLTPVLLGLGVIFNCHA